MASQCDLDVSCIVLKLLSEIPSQEEALLIEKLVACVSRAGADSVWLAQLQAEPPSVATIQALLPSLLDEFLLFFLFRQFAQDHRLHRLLHSDYDATMSDFAHWEDRGAPGASLADQLRE